MRRTKELKAVTLGHKIRKLRKHLKVKKRGKLVHENDYLAVEKLEHLESL